MAFKNIVTFIVAWSDASSTLQTCTFTEKVSESITTIIVGYPSVKTSSELSSNAKL